MKLSSIPSDQNPAMKGTLHDAEGVHSALQADANVSSPLFVLLKFHLRPSKTPRVEEPESPRDIFSPCRLNSCVSRLGLQQDSLAL